MFENDLLTFDGSPADVRAIADGLGLTITIFQPFRDFEAMPEPQRTAQLDRAERKFDVMQALGTDLVLVCSNVHPAAIDDDAAPPPTLRRWRSARIVAACASATRRWPGDGTSTDGGTPGTSCRRPNHAALGLIVDSFHTLAVAMIASGIARRARGQTVLRAACRRPRADDGCCCPGAGIFVTFPGRANCRSPNSCARRWHAAIDGPLSLEIFNDEFRAAPARLIARDGLRSLLLVEAEAGATTLPPPPVFDGIEFIEFAVDEEAGRRLGEKLRDLGFHYAGHHRSKSVDLFRQGARQLRAEQRVGQRRVGAFSVARPVGVRDGAAGGRCRDARWSVPAHCCARNGRSASAQGERRIPAVRAPDGTLVYLVQPDPSGRSIYEDDFRLFPDVPASRGADRRGPRRPGACRVGRMDNFVLFYRAVFGFNPEQLWEIADPYGLVRSRTMVSPDRSVRLPLNISESRETGTGRFLTTYAGAGVHHIAIATADIVQTMRQLMARGTRFLPIPANYYDDVAAKWGLDDEPHRRAARAEPAVRP